MRLEVYDCPQGSEEWRQARVGVVTCSELSKVLAKGQGLTRAKYMRQLAGEIITGQPAYAFQGNVHTERGTEQEPIARDLLQDYVGKPIEITGFIKNLDLRLGCSPDGLIGEDEGCEIKSCLADIQIERLEKGGVPSEHRAQVEGSILATGKSSWTFFSFSPGLPPLLVKATLTDERRREITDALAEFNAELDDMVERVKKRF